MKKSLAIFLFILALISLCSCSPEESESATGAPISTDTAPPVADERFENPPKLRLLSGENSFDTMSGTSSWSYHLKDDQWCSMEIDCDHPLNIPKHTEAISLSDGRISLSFEIPPNSFKIAYWPLEIRETDEFLNHEYPVPTILAENQEDITLCNGSMIYEVTAIWNENAQRNCYGDVSYVFWATVE